MTRSTIFDRLNHELEAFGKKAQAALDEGKLQIELLRVRRRRDNAARDFGLLVHQRERGQSVEQRRIDGLMTRLDELKAEISRLEQQVESRRKASSAGGSSSAGDSSTGEHPPVTVGVEGTERPVEG